MTHTNLFPTRNSVPQKARNQMIALLNQVLADGLDLYSHTKQAHWNLKGPQFMQVHLLLDSLAEKLQKHLDEVAERATALGGIARGTSRMVAAATKLKEYPIDNHAVEDHVKTLSDCYGHFANSLRDAINQADSAEDAGTADLFTQCLRDADKALWILESHLIDGSDKSSRNGSTRVHSRQNRNGKRLSHN